MKIIVAHPSKQHSFYTAIALKKDNSLFKYVTSVYDKKGTLEFFLKNFLSIKNKKKASTRKSKELDDSDVLVLYEFSGLLMLLIRRITFLRKILYNKIFIWRRKKFGKAIAEYAIKNNVDAVIMYDSTAVDCFSILKKRAPHIIRILDVSISHRLFMKMNFERDIEQTHDYNILQEEKILWNKRYMKDYIEEIKVSDFFFSPSQIVKDSLIYVGADKNQIKLIPYGVNVDQFLYQKKQQHELPLRLLYVGQISYRKGIHHLLKVISNLDSSKISLVLAGDYNKKSELYTKYKTCPNINFLGFVTRDKLAQYYQHSDIFIFPTLGEGYGLVVLEALSTGTPVVSSNLAGGNDIIKNGYNGYVFKGGNDKELQSILEYLINNMSIITTLSENARESVLAMTWESYYSNVQQAVRDILKLK